MDPVLMPDGQINRHKTAKKLVASYLDYNGYVGEDGESITVEDIYVVWFCKTLQNWKVLLSTDRINTGIYFEVTYNGDKGEAYLDHYKKVKNVVTQLV